MPHSIADSIHDILARVPNHVTLVAAVKQQSVEPCLDALQAGLLHLGDNYLQESQARRAELQMHSAFKPLAHKVCWHYIGALQSRKLKTIATHFDWVQSVTSTRELDVLSQKRAEYAEAGHDLGQRGPLSVLIEVNGGGELTKQGVPPHYDDVARLVRHAETLPHLQVRGLMCLPPVYEKTQENIQVRKHIVQLYEEFSNPASRIERWDTLSMGTTADWPMCIDLGATMIRLGTSLFGARPIKNNS